MGPKEIKGGKHLGVVREWIKCKARNGEHVTWGSYEYLDLDDITVAAMEFLSQDIRDAVLEEFKIRDHSYKYSYLVLSCGVSFQYAGTLEEIWDRLFRAKVSLSNNIVIQKINYDKCPEGELGDIVFRGSLKKAIYWCLDQRKGNE
jgi:hypothetical protein